jgi:two-component system, NtrC family, response regulator HydG
MTPCTLIVVDDATHGQMLVEGLREAGWNACAATGIDDALARMREQRPTLVVSDVRMDDGDGFDVLRAIRALGNRVPVILMSSFGTGAMAQEALDAGAYGYLPKPFALSELLALVTRVHASTRAPGG